MPGGAIIGALFFLLLTVAALTSSVSMLEVPASYFVDEKMVEKKSAQVVGALIFIFGIPSALSSVDGNFFANISVPTFDGEVTGFFGIIDYYFGTFFIVVVAFVTCIYVAWAMPIDNIMSEIDRGSKWKVGTFQANAFKFFIRYICPVTITLVLLNMMGVFGAFAGGG